jgi:hypothetical protein
MPTRVTAVAIALTLLVGLVSVGVKAVSDDGPAHPARWDPRVADLASFVEKARGLHYDHPVAVDFLSPAAYTKASLGDSEDLAADEIAELDRSVGQLRGLGVVSGKLDLAQSLDQVTDSGTLAFYSPEDQRIRVRGTDLSVGLRVTLVHELTHALQDQHFDLGKLISDSDDSSESTAHRGLGEGDALRIEDDYVDKVLTKDEQAAYDDEYAGEVATSEEATSDVPPFIEATFAAPYALGAPFVSMLFNDGGNKAVDEAFRHPPSTEEHLFDPASFLAHEGAKETDLDLQDVKVVDEGPFGSPSWFLVLGERIDPNVAFTAALGWGGDHYAVFERGGVTCTRAVFRGDTEQDEREMQAAIDTWLAALPGGKAKRIDVKGHPGFDACDPGPDVDMKVTGRSTDLLVLPNVWGYLVAEAAPDPDLGPSGARCFAAKVLDGLSYTELNDPSNEDALTAEVGRRATQAYLECGSGET